MIYLYLFGTCFHFIYVFMIIGKDQQGDGGEGTAHNSRVLRSVIEAKSSMTTSASVWVASV